MSDIVLKKCGNYDPEEIRAKVREGFDLLGGIDRFVKKGEKVLIKPNFLLAASAEAAITTHPELTRAVIRLIKEQTDRIIIGDSPGFGSFSSAAAKNGTKKVAEEEGIEMIEFRADTEIETPEKLLYSSFMIDSRVNSVDRIINLPKFKTHMLMYMTLCVKNMFGLISGLKKVEYHAKAEKDKKIFAKMLIDLYRAKPPAINIVDGIVGLNGHGPGTEGKPIHAGIIAMGEDGFALDHALARAAMIDPYRVYTNAVYKESVLNGKEISYNVLGEKIEDVKIKFEPPPDARNKGMFRKTINFLRGHATVQPVFKKKNCTGCEVCVKHCPVNCLEKTGAKEIKCDYSRCISCFCCHEMCPEQAITVKKPFLSFLFR